MASSARDGVPMIGTDVAGTREARAAEALGLMTSFALDSGLSSRRTDGGLDGGRDSGPDGGRPPVRYLWTDAFAVCNYLSLGELDLARRLVDSVHEVLAPLPGHLAAEHPTSAGLRIGKSNPERGPYEPFDADLEWERDGQYFHYLTKWMHALDQVARTTGDPRYNVWARELMATAFGAFTYVRYGARRMYWKMSIDLSRPLVASMGHHDPLDGYVTTEQLRATARRLGVAGEGPQLDFEAAEFGGMVPLELLTDDPLGIGALLTDAWRFDQLAADGVVMDAALRDRMVAASVDGLYLVVGSGSLSRPAEDRLPFRELGLALGLAAASMLRGSGEQLRGVEELRRFMPLRAEIERFWLRPGNRSAPTWLDHSHISDVMLATSLVPDRYLTLLV